MSAHQDSAVEAVARAMQEAVIRDDEGEFPRLFDLLDFSGENKARTVVNGLARAAIAAMPADTLREQRDELLEAAERMLPNNIALGNDAWPDSQLVPIDFTLGELRALRAAIAKARSTNTEGE